MHNLSFLRRMIRFCKYVWTTLSFILINNAMSQYICQLCLIIWRALVRAFRYVYALWPSSHDQVVDKEDFDSKQKCEGVQSISLATLDTAGQDLYVRDLEPYFFNEFKFLPVGKRVRFTASDGSRAYLGGSVVWTGLRTRDNERMTVLSLDEKHQDATDGIFDGQRLLDVRSHGNHQFVMLPYEKIEILPNFKKGDYCCVMRKENAPLRTGGFIRSDSGLYKLHLLNTSYVSNTPIQEVTFPDYHLLKAPPPESDPFSGFVDAISGLQFDIFLGRNKGIQGKRNSCYLDTLLFSFFAFSNDLNDKLMDCNGDPEVLSVLRYEIVFPLRACQFVSHHGIEHLRGLMADKTNKPSFLTDTRDIPECMDALFGELLRWKPMVSIGNGIGRDIHFNEGFAVEVINVNEVPILTSKQLLEDSSTMMQFCFGKMPECLLLQLARETNTATCVIPSLELDLKNLIYNTVKVCTSCKGNATLQFSQIGGDLAQTFFCDQCALEKELKLSDGTRLPESDMSTIPDEDTQLSLEALICIERSHYNCFVRCRSTDRWVFFDSMHNQETLYNPITNKDETFNIPLVEEVPKFRQWLEAASKHLKRSRSLEPLYDTMNEKELERGKRMFQCPYLMIYRKEN